MSLPSKPRRVERFKLVLPRTVEERECLCPLECLQVRRHLLEKKLCSHRAVSCQPKDGGRSTRPKSHPGLGWGGASGMQSSFPLPISTPQLPAQGHRLLPPEQLRPDSPVMVEFPRTLPSRDTREKGA